ncbi:hypothetical protein [Nitrospira sp. Nam80]
MWRFNGSFLGRAEEILILALLCVGTPAQGAEAPILPLSKIVLYSSGVGYFQHDGTVQDRARLDLRFNVNQINDLLKSLVVQDLGGGKVASVTYSSRDPVAKTLGSFSINLNGNPTLGQLLTQMRGESVELASPNPIAGTLIGVEKKQESVSDGGQRRLIETEYVNLFTEDGFRSIPLPSIQRITLVDAALNREVHTALAVLAMNHDTQKKTLSVIFDGTGSRQARIAYLTETPIWKTSYRLVLDDTRPAFLQGWAIVENTTEHDWTDVNLSLVSGRPISFIMDLYQPLYHPRPIVEPDLYASLRPQIYGEAMDQAARVEEKAEGEKREDPVKDGRRRLDSKKPMRAGVPPPATGAAFADEARAMSEGVESVAEGREAGSLFEYRLGSPVSLARQQSAMVPILGQEIQGRKVSIYNQTVNVKHPLQGYRLQNSSPLYLMQGPITVFDGGSYAGDARIEDIAPGQGRLISYALDLKMEVEPKLEGGQQELVSVAIKKGALWVTRRMVEDRTYQIRNRDQKERALFIEHPYRADWKLIEPKEAAERTRDVYRFAVPVEPGGSASLRVKESLPIQESVQLMDSGVNQILLYLQAKEVSQRVKEALQKVVILRNKLDDTRSQRARQEQRIAEITAEHSRIRDNMQRLQHNSELYNRYVTKLDQQETELEKIRKTIDTLKGTEEEQRRELQAYLTALDVS